MSGSLRSNHVIDVDVIVIFKLDEVHGGFGLDLLDDGAVFILTLHLLPNQRLARFTRLQVICWSTAFHISVQTYTGALHNQPIERYVIRNGGGGGGGGGILDWVGLKNHLYFPKSANRYLKEHFRKGSKDFLYWHIWLHEEPLTSMEPQKVL